MALNEAEASDNHKLSGTAHHWPQAKREGQARQTGSIVPSCASGSKLNAEAKQIKNLNINQ